MPATIKDVARTAGVSTATVSAVINESAYVSPTLTARVLEAVRDLNYAPSQLARRLRTGASGLIAMVVADLSNPFYARVPGAVTDAMNAFAAATGRQYQLAEYTGAPDAERVIVIMGSGGQTAAETAAYLAARGEKVGVVQLRLFRPFPAAVRMTRLVPVKCRRRQVRLECSPR